MTGFSFAKKTARSLKVKHIVIRTDELKDPRFNSNPLNRCYYCKKELFSRLKNIAAGQKIKYVLDASQVSDALDFRPGDKAKKELNIRSPLKEAGFSKEDIRFFSRRMDLPTWNMPSKACLASRFSYGSKISIESLRRVEKAESIIRSLGFSQVRVRNYDGLCRIEVDKGKVHRLVSKKDKYVSRLKKLGYKYITVDLEGYRSGSMNEGIER